MNKKEFKNQPAIKRKIVTNVTRRGFLSSCSACAACLALKPVSFLDSYDKSSAEAPKMKIRILYSLHGPVQVQPDWPNVGFDFNPPMEKINTTLKNHFPDFEFIPTLARGPEEAE